MWHGGVVGVVVNSAASPATGFARAALNMATVVDDSTGTIPEDAFRFLGFAHGDNAFEHRLERGVSVLGTVLRGRWQRLAKAEGCQ
jgi:hypothetical protein